MKFPGWGQQLLQFKQEIHTGRKLRFKVHSLLVQILTGLFLLKGNSSSTPSPNAVHSNLSVFETESKTNWTTKPKLLLFLLQVTCFVSPEYSCLLPALQFLNLSLLVLPSTGNVRSTFMAPGRSIQCIRWMMMLRGFWGQWPRVWSFLEVSTSVRRVCPVLQYYVIGYSLFSLQQQMAANEFCWFFVHWFKGFLCIGQESPTPGLRSRAGNHFLFHCVVWYFIPSSCRGWLLNRREGELCGSVTFWSTLQAS